MLLNIEGIEPVRPIERDDHGAVSILDQHGIIVHCFLLTKTDRENCVDKIICINRPVGQ